MSFDTQKQIAFTGIKNSELHAINMAAAQIRRNNRAVAFDAMLKTLKQVDEWHTKLGLVITTTPSVKDAILAAQIAQK